MEKTKWWKKALVYQIYPLSFMDSNEDGIGDIRGIISQLDYLKNLGVDVIWLSPIYNSPMEDNGYDISDYYNINPIFGSMDDFKELLSQVHKRKMRIIMDLVVNHTSNEHIWFKEALKDKNSKYRDYYIWDKNPNDIVSVFSGSAWEYDQQSGEYYFHLFSKGQPDLNWNNESLRYEIYKMINFWLDLGVDGFRLDVIDLIGKDVEKMMLADGPFLEKHLLEMYDNCFRGRDIMTVGETPGISIERAKELTTYPKNYLDMVFQFSHVSLDEEKGKDKWHYKKIDFSELKKVFAKSQHVFKHEGWNSLFWSNHDQVRAVSRYGSEKYWNKSAKMLMVILYGMKGTPYVYQGEELGMTGIKLDKIDEYKDVETINMYRDFISRGYGHDWIMEAIYKKGRDNSRTPIQWDDSINGGFSKVKPWIKVNENFKSINAKEQLRDVNSVYNFVKRFFKLRKENEVFTFGDCNFLNLDETWLFEYKRVFNNQEIIVVANFSDENQYLETNKYKKYNIMISNYNKLDNDSIVPPYWVAVYERGLTNGDN
ncbi:MAG: alpha-glucosidase [Acholeplasma sp.]|nr:alpha-glucosidase [Acholeplasma sp.]